jgi:hypothetical protein
MLGIVCAAGIVLGAGGCGSDSESDHVVTGGFPLYGPGLHWVELVRAGTVRFPAEATVDIDLNGDGVADSTVDASGPTTVARTDARETDADPGHRTHADLEIVELILSAPGIVVRAGDGIGNFTADGPLFSIGASDEATRDPRLSDDLFRFFFEIEIGDLTLHNRDPLIIVATIDRLPPIGNLFVNQGDPVALYDAEGNASPISVVSVRYTPSQP